MGTARPAVAFVAALIATTATSLAAAQEVLQDSPHSVIASAESATQWSQAPWSHVFEPTAPATSVEGARGTAGFPAFQLPDQSAAPPTPASTGFRAFVRTTRGDFASFPKRPSTWVILGVGAASALLAHPADDEANAHIVGSEAVGRFFAPGKWIGSVWAQAGASLGLYFGGRYLVPRVDGEPPTNKISHLGYDLLRAQIVSQVFIHSIKLAVRRDRPTGECCSFPSGHAAAAFASAAVLERHLGYRSAWPTLVIASYVAVSRLHDNRHFLSDILFGSSIGLATGWTIVGRHGRDAYALVPMPVRDGMGIALTRVVQGSGPKG